MFFHTPTENAIYTTCPCEKPLLETKVNQKDLVIFAQQLKFKHPYFYLPIASDNEKCIKEYKKKFLAVS